MAGDRYRLVGGPADGMLAEVSGERPTILLDVYKPPEMTLFGEAEEPPVLVWDEACCWYVKETE